LRAAGAAVRVTNASDRIAKVVFKGEVVTGIDAGVLLIVERRAVPHGDVSLIANDGEAAILGDDGAAVLDEVGSVLAVGGG